MKQVTKEYQNGVVALKDIDLSIEKGEFVFLVGKSGAGKSTLMKLLFREEMADKGKIIVGNRDISHLNQRKIAVLRRNIGIVFQDYKLLPYYNVYENIAFAMRVTGATTLEINRRVPRLLEMVGLTGKAKRMPNQLSGGEQQRVAVARALANKPFILFADEPTGNLDPENSTQLVDLLERINEMGTTILMATHSREIVNQMQKRVIRLERGEIVEDYRGGVY